MNSSAISHKIDVGIRFFLYVLVFWLPYSPAVIESCVITALILWIAKRGLIAKERILGADNGQSKWMVLLKSFRPVKTVIDYPIVCFLFIGALSSAFSNYQAQALHGLITKTLEWFVIYYLVLEVFREKKHLKILLAIFLFTAFSTAIDSFVQLIWHKDIFYSRALVNGYRATGPFQHPNGLGAFWSIALPISLAFIFLKGKGKAYRFLFCLLSLCFSVSLFMTFSRGAWLAVVLSIIFLIGLWQRKVFFLGSVLLLVVTLVSSIYFLNLNPSGKKDFLLEKQRLTTSWRLEIWKESWEMIKLRPFLGYGLNTYMVNFQKYRERPIGSTGTDFGPTYAHNCYIQMMAEVGVVGMGAFVFIIFLVFRDVLRMIYRKTIMNKDMRIGLMGLLSGLAAFLLQSFVDTNFYSLQLSAYLWFCVGVMVATQQLQQTDEKLAKD